VLVLSSLESASVVAAWAQQQPADWTVQISGIEPNGKRKIIKKKKKLSKRQLKCPLVRLAYRCMRKVPLSSSQAAQLASSFLFSFVFVELAAFGPQGWRSSKEEPPPE
jgi:hypothetical protein